jgi:Sec-independent protein translocase protein TatA
MNVLTDPISIWHLLLVLGVVWLYFWNEQRKLKQDIKEHGERVEELYRENAELRKEELSTRNHSERHQENELNIRKTFEEKINKETEEIQDTIGALERASAWSRDTIDQLDQKTSVLDKKINNIERVNEEHFNKLFHHEKTMGRQSSEINEIKDTINLSIK